MSALDDDELAREIRQQNEDAPPNDERPVPTARVVRHTPPTTWKTWALIGGVFVVLGGVVTFLLVGTGAQDAFVYSKLVDEVMRDRDRYVGRELRVEGQLRQGSVEFVSEPSCEHTFVLERQGQEMPVRFARCVVPDTFRDDMPMDVVVQGQLQANGTFHASEVIPRCPSKYEMRQRQQNGEQMPHGPAGGETS
jgi:cytochrome c-type biogenesis protein CcmE